MYLLPKEDIYSWDAHTIQHENIKSIDLMDRAVRAFIEAFKKEDIPSDRKIYVFCGSGNNGGDGIGIAMQLRDAFYDVTVYLCHIGSESDDLKLMKRRLIQFRDIEVIDLNADEDLPDLRSDAVVIDALFGIGLSRPIKGYWAQVVSSINNTGATTISVDTPSGLPAEGYPEGPAIKADLTITFEIPKLSHLLPENHDHTGRLIVVSIGLDPSFIPSSTSRILMDTAFISPLLQPRQKFDHKGTFGHACLVCGSFGMLGAAVLAGAGCLRAGVGKLTMVTPECGYNIIQSALPEALARVSGENALQDMPAGDFDAMAIGCGIGEDPDTSSALKTFLEQQDGNRPLVLDADALNIIAKNNWLELLPDHTILTPHIKEFDRLFGPHDNHDIRLKKAMEYASRYSVFIVLKGAFTSIQTPDGMQFFNTSGNPGLATAGSGDVLTGIICSLLAQGYSPGEACQLGVYVHGRAADEAVRSINLRSLTARDIPEYLSHAYNYIEQWKG